ncbi:MAG: aldo/keto reductase [Limnochordia bacterium]|jgi:aryl-alcohol dehydrogenase-like predicted oxidoreductase
MVEKRQLGRWRVSRLCFGSLALGPLQNRLPLSEGAALLREGLEMGINFIDTADLYGTYPYIREALKGYAGEVIIASKSYAVTAEEMAQTVERARRELDRDRIEIWLLHEQESAHTLRGHRGAIDYLLEAKERGIIGSIGLSTHHIAGVRAGAVHEDMEIIMPLINKTGIGIVDGTAEEMCQAMELAQQMGKGLFGMKPLGGGHLRTRAEEALQFCLGLDSLASIAVGMKSRAELLMNIKLFQGEPIENDLRASVQATPRALHVESWCLGCGACVEACSAQALSIVDDRCRVDSSRCILCGYCGAACPDFALKII